MHGTVNIKNIMCNIYCFTTATIVARKRVCYLKHTLHLFFDLVQTPFNHLKIKLNLLYISTQSVPRSKHFPPRL